MSVHGLFEPLKLLNVDFSADPVLNPAVPSIADPDPVFQKHADSDPDPQHCF